MFSIAAINDTASHQQWEPLAPTKEAQEFYLSQKYHDGLLCVQAKEYGRACELFESILEDPLISSIQVGNSVSDDHLLQLRFLTLKNLATVSLQQGPMHYKSALKCYLQAVELDCKDSVVWNQLGTLTCSMGLLSISRWAFEQGLLCSPNNWNCMEKLLEVLIAIGDEVACLAVSELILRHWPSHSRALHVRTTIKESEPMAFAPRGIDKLKPKHVRLRFPEKRKHLDEITGNNGRVKKHKDNNALHLAEISWAAVIDRIFSAIKCIYQDGGESPVLDPNHEIRITIHLPSSLESTDSIKERAGAFQGDEKMKEREVCLVEEHSQERRSTRLERLRSRKPVKELDFSASEDPAKIVLQYLEPFVDKLSARSKDCCTRLCVIPGFVPTEKLINHEESDVKGFLVRMSSNYGAYHVAHIVLEEISHKNLPYQEVFLQLLELEKITRGWSEERTKECNLFLAELYYDFGSCYTNTSKRSEFFCETTYHLCKIIEHFSLDIPDCGSYTFPRNLNSLLTSEAYYWTRFFWLSGRMSYLDGDKKRADKEFHISLSILEYMQGDSENSSVIVPLSHCKIVRGLTIERVLHEIHLLEVDTLLRTTTSDMFQRGMFTQCAKMLGSLLCAKDAYVDLLSCTYRVGDDVTSVELAGLNTLLAACEKESSMDIELYLNSHLQKLRLLSVAAGMMKYPISDMSMHANTLQKSSDATELIENMGRSWKHMLAEEVKAISVSASQLKHFMSQIVPVEGFSALLSTVGEIQTLLLTLMCNIIRVSYQKSSGLDMTSLTDQMDKQCFVDSAVAFCLLQHLNPSISIKIQVELIVAIHDLLAEYGLCCAGQDKEGQDGTFLKLSIKHLLALSMLLKSNVKSSNMDMEVKDNVISKFESKTESCVKLSTQVEDQIGNSPKDILEEPNTEISNSVGSPCWDDGREDAKGVEQSLHSHGEGDNDEATESRLDSALCQSFFCLYGINLKSGQDSCGDDGLSVHQSTNPGEYQTKEQCADVLQYILSYVDASSKSGLVKLRKVLRAIHRHFLKPPEHILNENRIDKFLDNPDICEEKLSSMAVGSQQDTEFIINSLFLDGSSPDTFESSLSMRSDPYMDVHKNLYFLVAHAEEMSATDKWPGFVLTKEGEDFVEQCANLFKYDLLYNPLRFESWQRLAQIYDEEVDLLLNDGSKHINVLEWRKHPSLPQRVEVSRRRAKRCSLMGAALAKIPFQQSQMQELLALICYDSLQNVVPCYDQRSIIPVKDATWMALCFNSMRHFKKAFQNKPDWSHALYLGKLCEKLQFPSEKAFSYYRQAITLNSSAVDPVYRMHASRLKLLYKDGKQNLMTLKVVAMHSFSEVTRETVLKILGRIEDEGSPVVSNDEYKKIDFARERKCLDPHQLEESWNMLYNDCLSGLEICIQGDLKHFHKARYMLAKGLFKRGQTGDLDRAKDELSFCFKSSRSSFTINMWEIDGMARKGRKRTAGLGGNKKALEVNLSESSRKFITCIRKYIIFYFCLLEKTGDFYTLERAYLSVRTDKRFSLSLEDVAPIAFGRYIQALISSIHCAEVSDFGTGSSRTHLLDRLFNVFIDHGNFCIGASDLPDFQSHELAESAHNYIHEYFQLLEEEGRFEILEVINEKIRKRIKNPKLSNVNIAKICKHASLSWCRSLLVGLAMITPIVEDQDMPVFASGGSERGGTLLFVDLHIEDVCSFEDASHWQGLETKWAAMLSKLVNVQIKQALEENMEAANSLLRSVYSFCRDSPCINIPLGINLYIMPSSVLAPGSVPNSIVGNEILELSVPRKLLMWAYTLVFGNYSDISVVVKHLEEAAKSKLRRGPMGCSGKERTGQSKCDDVVDYQPPILEVTSIAGTDGPCPQIRESSSGEYQKVIAGAPPLQQCSSRSGAEWQAVADDNSS